MGLRSAQKMFSILLLLSASAAAAKGKAGEEILNRKTLFSKGYKERIGLNKTARAALGTMSSSSSSFSTSSSSSTSSSFSSSSSSESRRLQTGGGGWSTEHFDIANSGLTAQIGPGDVTGFCRTPVIESSLLNPNRERFYATGVTTINDNDLNLKFWLGGGNRNQFRMIQIMGPASFQEWDLDLETVRPGYPNATTYGVISSGSTWANDVADNIALPSTDGTIYTLFWLSCIDSLNNYKQVLTGEGANSVPRPAMHPIEAERMAMIESQKASNEQTIPGYPTIYRVDPLIKARLLKFGPDSTAETHPMTLKDLENDPFKDPFPTCVQWTAALGANGTKPSYSPTRFVPGLNGNPDLVLASESDPDLDTNGVLWAFNAKNGSVAWSHQAIDNNGLSWGLTGIVPAVDNTNNNVVFIAYGVTVRALNGLTGAVMGTFDATSVPDPVDPSDYQYISGSVNDLNSNVIETQTGVVYDDAISYCTSLPACVGIFLRNGQGFDASDPYTFDPAATVYYMSSLAPGTYTPQPFRRRFIIFQKPGLGTDPFISSPTISADRTALFLHSVYGTIFKVSYTFTDPNTVSFGFTWACDYLASVPDDQQVCQTSVESLYKEKLAYPVYTGSGDSFKVVPSDVSKGEHINRRDFVGGGWPQPTTRKDRNELYEMIKTTYLSTHSTDELTAAASRHPALAYVSIDSPPLTMQEASAIMRVFRSEGKEKMIHTMRTKSGYTRLDGRGVAIDVAEAAQREVEIETAKRASTSKSTTTTITAQEPLVGLGGGGIWFSLYPFSTPAQRKSDLVISIDVLVVPQYLPYLRGTEGVFAVNQVDGSVKWSWNGVYTEEGQRVSFGRSRSSPAIDGDDYVYIGADTPDPFYGNRSGFTLPTLYAFDLSDGFLMWATGMGFATNTLVNSASPIITDGFQDANTAFMVADLGISYLNEGVSCPSDDPIFECSRYGTCDCNTGTCTCSQGNKCVAGPECKPLCLNGDCDDSTGPPCSCYPCWRGDYCDTYQQCGNGFCQQSSDQCVCQPCFVQDGSGACNTPKCGAHGTCNGGGGTCTCTDGYTGSTCNIPPGPPPSPSPSNSPSSNPVPSSGPSGGDANASAAGASPGLVGGLVAFPIILIGGLAGYLYHFRTKNPQKPLHAALPDSMQKALGFSGGSYSTVTHMPGVKLYASSTTSAAAASASTPTPALSKSAAAAMTKTMPAFVKGNAEATQARISLLSAKKGAAYGGV